MVWWMVLVDLAWNDPADKLSLISTVTVTPEQTSNGVIPVKESANIYHFRSTDTIIAYTVQ